MLLETLPFGYVVHKQTGVDIAPDRKGGLDIPEAVESVDSHMVAVPADTPAAANLVDFPVAANLADFPVAANLADFRTR